MIRLSTGLRTNLAGTTGFASTFANGVIEIRTGTQPTSADSAASGTLLGLVTIASGPFTPGTQPTASHLQPPPMVPCPNLAHGALSVWLKERPAGSGSRATAWTMAVHLLHCRAWMGLLDHLAQT